jgi:2-iminobutanoate/2-iminopropanoate deaminase
VHAVGSVVQTEAAPAALGPYSQAIKAGTTLYISGQLGLDPKSMQFVSEDVSEQTKQVSGIVAPLRRSGRHTTHVPCAEVPGALLCMSMAATRLASRCRAKRALQVMVNMEAILKEAGLTFDNVVKTTVLLADMTDFGAVNEVYGATDPALAAHACSCTS